MKSMKSSSFLGQAPRVCVPVMAGNVTDALDIMNELAADEACEIIEWRLDALERPGDFDQIQMALDRLENAEDTAILLTMRTKNEGGLYPLEGQELIDYYMSLAGLRGVDGIDIQYRDLIGRDGVQNQLLSQIQAGEKAVILSWHDFKSTPNKEDIKVLALDMKKLGPDLVKMAFMPVGKLDVEAVKEAGIELKDKIQPQGLVLISMGALGTEVRINAAKIGSCFTFGCRPGEESAPGQIEYHELRRLMEEAIMEKPIFLIGYMGAGKSTVGRELGKKLNCEWIDLDKYIVDKAKMSINDIFEMRGEPAFRKMETEALKEVSAKNEVVISCGGGIVTQQENIDYMRDRGLVVLLEATPESIYQRICHNQDRPLLKNKMSIDAITEMKELRAPMYNQAAHVIIATDGLDKFDICGQICDSMRNIAQS